jgi:hypothetical protein
MKQLFAILILISAAQFVDAQTGQLPAATQASTALTLTYPAACTTANPCTSQIFRCVGTAAVCTATSSNWTPIASVVNNGTSYADNTGVAGTTYTYEDTIEQGATNDQLIAGPSNLYTGTPTTPLAPATISGVTS